MADSSMRGTAAPPWRRRIRAVIDRVTGRSARPRSADRGAPTTPGQAGPDATDDVDANSVGQVRMTYRPRPDDAPDPGEVVWSWVPYEEHDGRGKDRPLLLVAAEPTASFLAVSLTSKSSSDASTVSVGSGGWDAEGRESFARLDRVFRVHPSGMRRIGAAVTEQAFARVATELVRRHGWQTTR